TRGAPGTNSRTGFDEVFDGSVESQILNPPAAASNGLPRGGNKKSSTLDARGTAPRDRPHLFQCRHARVAGKSGQERAMRPAELQIFLIANQHVHVLDDPIQHLRRALASAGAGPQLLTII